MKKRLISLIIISTLSLSLLVGCGEKKESVNDNNSSTNVEDTKTSNDDKSKEDTTTENEDNTKSDEDITNESGIKEAFTDTLNELYNIDYSVKENKDLAKELARSKFSEEGFEEFIKKINDYSSEFKASDILITKVTEVKNDNTSYAKAYEIRYNVTITEGKPSNYSDLIGIVVEDRSGNFFINSINQNNF